MTVRLALAPLWARLLAYISLCWAMGSFMLATWRAGDGAPPRDLPCWWIVVGIAGILIGALAAAAGGQARANYRAAMDGVARQDYRSVIKALVRGPLPADSAPRSAAIRLADVYLLSTEQTRRLGPAALVMLCLMALLAIMESLTRHPNPASFVMNLPIWLCFTVQIYYVVPLVEARRALMLNSEGVQF